MDNGKEQAKSIVTQIQAKQNHQSQSISWIWKASFIQKDLETKYKIKEKPTKQP